jgi:alpha-glucosidase
MYNFINTDTFLIGDQNWSTVGDVIGYVQTGNIVDLHFAKAPNLRLVFHTPKIFRVRFNKDGDYSSDLSYAVDTAALPSFLLSANNIVDAPTQITINTGSLQLVIDKSPYRLSVWQNGQLISQDDSPRDDGRYIEFIQESTANYKAFNRGSFYYGFGLKAGLQLDKSAETMTFFNFDNFCAPADDGQAMYTSVPLMIEVNPANKYAYAIFLDNPSQTYFDLGSRFSDVLYFGALFGELNYYFIAGDDIKDVLTQYTGLTGRSVMPPKFVFGFHQGGYGIEGPTLQTVAKNYRNSGIPIDGLHIDVDFQDGYRTFTTSQQNFPAAPALIQELKAQGFKCSTNITAMIKNDSGTPPYTTRDEGFATATGDPWGVFLSDPNGGPYVGTENYGQDPNRGNMQLAAQGFYPDFTRPGVADWWGRQYNYLFNTVGIEMVWQDMMCPAIDPQPPENPTNPNKTFPLSIVHYDFGRYQPNVKIHNHYGLKQLEATTKGLKLLQPNKRQFIIARGGYASLQKYAAVWTGDSASEWPDYARNIAMVLNLGLSGIPISGSDIGGFANGKDVYQDGAVSAELLTRWMTMGAFLPWYRNHYDTYTKAYQEPWAYSDPAVVANCKIYVQLRYHLLPLFYDLMWEHTQTGLPIARPVFLEDPFEPVSHKYGNTQFMLGRDLLIAPVLSQGAITKTVWLPTGNWFEYQFNKDIVAPVSGTVGPIPGAQTIGETNVGLDKVPVYVRAGAIIPTWEVRPYVDGLPNPVTVDIYPGADNAHVLYQDDETTMAYAAGAYRTTQIAQLTVGNTRTITATRLNDVYTPAPPDLYLRLLGVPAPPIAVTLDGTNVAIATTPLVNEAGDAYLYDPGTHTLSVKLDGNIGAPRVLVLK